MHLMQYEITLPADYDMGIIRRRVETRGPRTDDFPGLGIKAYLIRERGAEGSPVNQYAPFYLWADPAGMDEFLFGPGFEGIRTDFGRPTVHNWRGIAYCEGPAGDAPPVAATRSVESTDPGVSLIELSDRLHDDTTISGQQAGVTCSAVGIDPSSWQVVRMTLWAGGIPDTAPGERYAVLHVSQPYRADLPRFAPTSASPVGGKHPAQAEGYRC